MKPFRVGQVCCCCAVRTCREGGGVVGRQKLLRESPTIREYWKPLATAHCPSVRICSGGPTGVTPPPPAEGGLRHAVPARCRAQQPQECFQLGNRRARGRLPIEPRPTGVCTNCGREGGRAWSITAASWQRRPSRHCHLVLGNMTSTRQCARQGGAPQVRGLMCVLFTGVCCASSGSRTPPHSKLAGGLDANTLK